MRKLKKFFPLFLSMLLFPLVNSCGSQEQENGKTEDPDTIGNPDVVISVDLTEKDMISNFEIGLTHTHRGWENGHPDAVSRVKTLLEEAGIRYQNTHIMGWGPGNPQPTPNEYDWSSLDSRIDLIMSMENTIPVITFCTAPGWMKTSGDDWEMGDRIADEHVGDFANLCREVALRYPDVQYFQIWNEFKGYRSWTDNIETKDIERFTTMYNAVYDAVKSVRPDVIIGGPYIPMEGRDIGPSEHQDIEYWLENGHGADFFTYDGWLTGYPPEGHTEEWMMSRTGFFGNLTKEFGSLTNLPVWVSEYYAGSNSNEDFTAANHASSFYHSLKNDTRVALLWDEAEIGALFSDTVTADGGQPAAHYNVVKAFNKNFGPGTQLYSAKSSSDNVEVLASSEKIMLINKLPKSVSVQLGDKELILGGYEVRIASAQ